MHVPTRRAPRADLPTAWGGETSPPGALRAPTSPLRGEAKPPHLAARVPRADLPTAWGGETSPPGCARSARRPPHCVGRRNLPTWLRALRAPTSPLRGEAKPPHLAARVPRADLPTAWGGETSPPGALRAPTSPPGALRAPTSPLRGEATGADLPLEIG